MIEKYSDYIIYIDESGDANWSISKDFPVLCLNFCIFHKQEYLYKIIPEFNAIKFKYWGTDNIVFHERDFRRPNSIENTEIRQKYSLLKDKNIYNTFMDDLNEFIENANFKIFSVLLDKRHFTDLHKQYDPYHICLSRGLRQIHDFLLNENMEYQNLKTHFIFEQRGRNEDKELGDIFKKIKLEGGLLGANKTYCYDKFYCEFMNKRNNSTGLQIADLTARPIALHYLNNTQNDRALNIIKSKMFYCDKIQCKIGEYDVVHKKLK